MKYLITFYESDLKTQDGVWWPFSDIVILGPQNASLHAESGSACQKPLKTYCTVMRGSRKFFQKGSNFDYFFFFFFFFFFKVDDGREDPDTTISGSPLAGQTLNAGLVALWYYRGSGPVLVRNPIFL